MTMTMPPPWAPASAVRATLGRGRHAYLVSRRTRATWAWTSATNATCKTSPLRRLPGSSKTSAAWASSMSAPPPKPDDGPPPKKHDVPDTPPEKSDAPPPFQLSDLRQSTWWHSQWTRLLSRAPPTLSSWLTTPPPLPALSAADSSQWYYQRVSFWMKRYENFVGLTEVKAAQRRVVEAEKKFIDIQEERRERQRLITDIQMKLKQIHTELEKTHRAEDKYLTLVTEEHQITKEERAHLAEFQQLEKQEREYFSLLSTAVRDSHEQERAQAEKTKYWSVIGSIVGTCLGILGTTINNRMRMNELRRLVATAAEASSAKEGGVAVGVAADFDLDALDAALRRREDELKELVEQLHAITEESKASLEKTDALHPLAEALKTTSSQSSPSSQQQQQQQQQQQLRRLESQTSSLHAKADDLQRSARQQAGELSADLAALRADLAGQADAMRQEWRQRRDNIEILRETQRDLDVDLQESFRSLYNNQTALLDALREKMGETETRIAGVADILRQAQASASARREKERNVLENLDEGLVDRIELVLDEHEARTRQAVVWGGLVAAVVAPAAVYAVNKVLE